MGKIFLMSEQRERIRKIPIQAEAKPKLRIGICEARGASIHKFAHTSKFFVTGDKIRYIFTIKVSDMIAVFKPYVSGNRTRYKKVTKLAHVGNSYNKFSKNVCLFCDSDNQQHLL